MLSPDDLQIVERDQHIQGLGTVLDTDTLTNALRAHLPDAGIRALQPDYIHYKPYTNCLVAGQLKTSDKEIPFYAKAYGADGPVKLEKTRDLQKVASPLGPGTLILEDSNIGVYFFPVDHRLKGLRRLADPVTQRSLLSGLLGRSHDFLDATLRPLRYKPERRFVACLESPTGQRMLLKFFEHKRYKAAKRASETFSAPAPAETQRENFYFDRHCVMGQEWLPGQSLSDFLLSRDAPESDRAIAIERTGAALARLHSHAAGGLREQLRTEESERLRAQAATIGHLCPAIGQHAATLALQLASSLQEVSPQATTLHGDFYDRQVLLSDGTPVVIDLDEAMLGHPAVDLGLFDAHLERHRLYDRLTDEEVDTFTKALLRGYVTVRPAPSQAEIDLYTAIGLLHLAAEPFRHCEPDWRGRVAATLEHVETILGRKVKARPVRSSP